MKRAAVLTLGIVVVAALAAPGGAPAKKHSHHKGIGGKVVLRVPAFDPQTGTSLATGVVRAKHGCNSPRVIRFAYFTPQGQPIEAGQPAVVTAPGGSFIAALPRPDTSSSATAVVVKSAVDARTINGVRCRALRGPSKTIALTPTNN